MNKQKRHKPEEIILLLRECDASSLSQEQFCQKKQISVATLHRWRKKYGMMDVADAKRLKALEKENAELKKMYADAMLGIKVLQSALEKKAVSAAHRRSHALPAVSGGQCSERQASGYFRLHRSTLRYRPKFPCVKQQSVDQAIVDLSIEHPEFGSDKVGRLVRNRGLRVSSERVRKARREESLQVPPPKKKQCRTGHSTGRFPKKASRRGHVWTWDFIHDTTIKGGSYRVISVVDEYTREVHALQVARNIGSGKVLEVISELIGIHGAPGYIRSDNGPEFIAKSLQSWLAEEGIKTLYIDPGCPWQNGYVESFHDKFRRECLARELFFTLSEAKVVIAAWRKKFNQVRPHRSLGMKTPEEFAFGRLPAGGLAAQSASYAAASGLRSGSRLTSRWHPLSINPNPLTLSGP